MTLNPYMTKNQTAISHNSAEWSHEHNNGEEWDHIMIIKELERLSACLYYVFRVNTRQ